MPCPHLISRCVCKYMYMYICPSLNYTAALDGAAGTRTYCMAGIYADFQKDQKFSLLLYDAGSSFSVAATFRRSQLVVMASYSLLHHCSISISFWPALA